MKCHMCNKVLAQKEAFVSCEELHFYCMACFPKFCLFCSKIIGQKGTVPEAPRTTCNLLKPGVLHSDMASMKGKKDSKENNSKKVAEKSAPKACSNDLDLRRKHYERTTGFGSSLLQPILSDFPVITDENRERVCKTYYGAKKCFLSKSDIQIKMHRVLKETNGKNPICDAKSTRNYRSKSLSDKPRRNLQLERKLEEIKKEIASRKQRVMRNSAQKTPKRCSTKINAVTIAEKADNKELKDIKGAEEDNRAANKTDAKPAETAIPQLSYIPILCPAHGCNCAVFPREFQRHIQQQHASIPILQMELELAKTFLFKAYPLKLNEIQVLRVFQVRVPTQIYGTDNKPKHYHVNIIPMCVSTHLGRIIPKFISSKPVESTPRILLVWVAGLVPTNCKLTVTLSVYGEMKTMQRTVTRAPFPLQKPLDLKDIYGCGSAVWILEEDLDRINGMNKIYLYAKME